MDELSKKQSTPIKTNLNKMYITKITHFLITELRDEDKEILWGCGDCDFEGTISEWQNTKWDNSDG